jgi:phage baseplate assembly protein W
MAGMDRNTGKPLSGWAHVEQSIADLFTTPKASRAMRRLYGSDLPRKVDSPMSPANLVDFFAAAAGAIDLFEPRFKVTQMQVGGATPDGHLTLDCEGVYFPRGHLGDFTVAEPQRARLAV